MHTQYYGIKWESTGYEEDSSAMLQELFTTAELAQAFIDEAQQQYTIVRQADKHERPKLISLFEAKYDIAFGEYGLYLHMVEFKLMA